MKKVILQRVSYTQNGTFGVLMDSKGMPLCVTLEDPWNNNERNVSCIPTGTYKVVPHDGTKFRDVWRLENVPDRSAILIHVGNSILDTSGCILVGRSFNAHTIRDSNNALGYLKSVLPDRFTIEVRDTTKAVTSCPFLGTMRKLIKGD